LSQDGRAQPGWLDRNKSSSGHAVNLDGFAEHGGWPDPEAMGAIQGAVQRHRLQRLAVPHGAEHFVFAALVVAVAAEGRFDQGREVFVVQRGFFLQKLSGLDLTGVGWIALILFTWFD